MSRRAFLGLGSNLGERLMYLRGAIDAIPDLVSVSSLYETDPIGGPEQGAYLNCVVALDTDLTPRELLELCRVLEAAADRVDGEVVDESDLVVPHPRWRDRAFVMVPLGELAPDLLDGWVDPGEGDVHKVGSL
jgi:2-amino-4-hydroxy-6-hydroxymethyldihydropteridine diphosphokinase